MVDTRWQHLRLDRDGWIATLTLSRPPVNALSREMVRELAAAAGVLAVDESVSVVVIRSDQRHFCAGADLALACDLRIMADDVRFGFSETSLGIIPGAGGTQRLPRLIGLSKAKELIFSARILDSAECLELGLADRVVPAADLHQAAHDYAAELACNAPLALRAAKQAIIQGLERSMEEGLESEGEAYDSLIHTRDRGEGIRAFMEKRRAEWRGE